MSIYYFIMSHEYTDTKLKTVQQGWDDCDSHVAWTRDAINVARVEIF